MSDLPSAPAAAKPKRASLRDYQNTDDLPVRVGEFQKNVREVGVAEFCAYNNKLLFQLRNWYWHKESGELRPTRDGIAIQVDQLDDLANLVLKAWAEAQARGWIVKKPEAAE